MTASDDELAELLTLTLTVDQWGTRRYRNSQDELHRQHGPAVEWVDGTRRWWLNGQRHRIDGPAIECESGHREWYLDGEQLTEREFHERFDDVIRTPLSGTD